MTDKTTTTKPFPTRWSSLHESDNAIMFHCISKSFLILLLMVFLSLPLPLVTRLSSIWSTLLTKAYKIILTHAQPSKARIYHLFYNRCYPNFLPNAFICNPIFSSMSTHVMPALSSLLHWICSLGFLLTNI